MKTAISVPDSIFQAAETFARKQKMSRSELYATALAAYLQQHHVVSLTEKLNEVYSTTPTKLEDEWQQAQVATLAQEEW